MTDTFEGKGVKPPPRTIWDIEARFPTTRIPPSEIFALFCNGAEREVTILAKFKKLTERYGVLASVIDDPYVRSWGIGTGWQLRSAIATIEQRRGNLPEAIEYAEWIVDSMPNDTVYGKFARATAFAQLAAIYADAGNLNAAKKAIRSAQSTAARSGLVRNPWLRLSGTSKNW